VRPPRESTLENPGLAFRLKTRLRRTALVRSAYRRRRNREADVFLLSFPKAGRTWLRLLIGKAIAVQHDLAPPDLMALEQLADAVPGTPRIRCKHDDDPQWKRPDELVRNKSEYRDRRVILLGRDMRDLVVSAYFQVTRRERAYDGDIRSFVYARAGSLETMIRFYNIWAENREIPAGFLLVRYEDLHADPHGELRRVLDFSGLAAASDDAVRQAVEYARFDNMRKLESADALDSARLRPKDEADPESFKTRRGVVGGYVDYLEPAEIRHIEERVRADLDPLYRYI
jgi:hypothetical protein